MIPDNLQKNPKLLRIMQSTMIGLPSPSALKSEKFPGVRIGSDPVLGNNCIVYGNVFIGNQFKCGDNVLIRDNSAIGDKVTIGSGSFIDKDVVIADSVVIGEDVKVSRDTRIGSRVVIGRNVRFLTEPVNRRTIARRSRGIILEDDCTIGINAVLGPGVCVGAGASVKDNAVVTEDLP